MSSYLLCSSPIYGHIAPMLTIGRRLVQRGDIVTVLTGRKYRDAVEAGGMVFRPLPDAVDYDDANLDRWLPGREGRTGLDAVRFDLIGMFGRVIPDQYRAVEAALAEGRYDAIVAEGAFTGVLPKLLKEPAGTRLPIIGISALPVTLTSVDTAPFGPAMQPGRGPVARLRNRMLNRLVHSGPLKPIQTTVDAALAEVGAPPAPGNFFDFPSMFDHTIQLSASGLEYPRRETPSTLRFVGPLRPEAGAATDVPEWWGDLDGTTPVVHVTQGTIDNLDFERLVAPTIRALAGEDVLVVATTGGRDVEPLLAAFGGDLPANARIGRFLPYGELLPRCSVLVTNGGFGGVQQALGFGVPLVVAGATEDKPEVAARVAWSGAGIELRTGDPKPERIRRAVLALLADPAYRAAARRLQAELRALPDPIDVIVETLEQAARTHA
ncbi:nucleotide disphospho-sugar-binding domain-containing protein [Herbiconiux sp. L3-i23]|uniref:nucleotide disphospho-sugar-binding domain-containing protein n=1 Tax=Herbiconiux sp. L3-i23 TaxID=2905871 RepID=UPI0020677747|nr:nucleotide disphospho-sugar-binding domain-containing protein [Herbiconiux sp. L3-i23]BDI21781.1 glycosyl transferase [Herbiconiux sp. L3-i23]